MSRPTVNADGDDSDCCAVRDGFHDAYNNTFRNDLVDAIYACIDTCNNKTQTSCDVVLTGHSQGGAIASVAALYLADLSPSVVSFGMPLTVYEGCQTMSSIMDEQRWYRYVNSRVDVEQQDNGNVVVTNKLYDPIPFAPWTGTQHVGHLIVLSEDTTGVAYLGLGSQQDLSPYDLTYNAHSMDASENLDGYYNQIKAIMDKYSSGTIYNYPIRSTGYKGGISCTINEECSSGTCELRDENDSVVGISSKLCSF